MYNMPRFISVFHMKFVGIVKNLWILSVSQPKLTFRKLVKKCENKDFSICLFYLYTRIIKQLSGTFIVLMKTALKKTNFSL